MDIRIPGYDIVREARRGGQGVIFQALQKSTNRKVAVKVLLDGALADEKTLERFRREVDIVAGLRHPHIVAAFDCGETSEGHPYFVMDFVYGQRLNDYVVAHKLSVRQIVELFVGICDGVNYAHQRGIIHRDLKPANIIIDAEGRPRVLDFGLARRVDATAQSITTMAGGVVGTLAYMSPEQVRGPSSEIDVRTDVYSLGVMLYESVAGRLPYAVDGDLAVAFRNITDADPATLDRSSTSLPDAGTHVANDLKVIILKALAKLPDRRYQNAGELGADLRNFLAGKPIEARRDSRMYVLKTVIRRHRGPVAALIAFVVLLISWGATLSVLYAREQRLTRQIQVESAETLAQRDRAVSAEHASSERFAMVREMASDLLFEAHDRVATLAGATPARALVVQTALKYLDDLERDAGDDPALRLELAKGLLRLGNVQGGLGLSNLGDTDAAIQSYSRAVDLCTSALATTPQDDEWLTILAELHSKIGGLLLSQNQSQEALTHYESALTIVRELLHRNPEDRGLRASYAHACQQIGNVHAINWEMEVARQQYDEASRVFSELVKEVPQNETFRRELAMIQLRIARVILVSDEKQDDALPFVERAITALRALAAESPATAGYARDLGIALDHRADVLMRRGDTDEAIESLRESGSISQKLADLDPENAQARHDLVIGRNDLGRALMSTNRIDEARDVYQQALSLAVSLSEKDPSSAIFRRDVGHCHDNIASVHAARNDAAQAVESLTKAIDVYESLLKVDPENLSVLRDNAIAQYNRGERRLEIAADRARSVAARNSAIADARMDFEQYRHALMHLRDRDRLAEFEIKFIARADEKIARCEELSREIAADAD
ncbi:MAG: protein kinase [Phycisphaerales bacterium]|nr:protein kinase [Phycisphaerales bacterium]